MSLSVRNRPNAATLSKSTNLASSSMGRSGDSKSKTLNNAKLMLNSSTALENIEIEYIKNLQQQVYFLELECNYLRQQLTQNGLHSSFKYDKESNLLKSQMHNMSVEKSALESSLREENAQKEKVLEILDESEKQFYRERELLLKEIEKIKKQKQDLEEMLLNRSYELSRTKEDLNRQSVDVNESLLHLTKTEHQSEQLRRDNVALRAEINDARTMLIARDNLIKNLQSQLSDPTIRRATAVHELKNSLNSMSTKLSVESHSAKQVQEENSHLLRELELFKNKCSELSKENSKLSTSLEISLKQNEADLILAKKNADLSKHNLEKFQLEIENEKNFNKNLQTQIEQFKLQERLETKNQANLKKRIHDLEVAVSQHETEKLNYCKSVQEKLKSKERELNTEIEKLSVNYNQALSTNKNLELKLKELNGVIDKLQISSQKEIELLKSKSLYAQTELDNQKQNVLAEKTNFKALQAKLDSHQRQEEIQSNLISSLKLRISELEHQVNANTHREPELLIKLKDERLKVNDLEEENRKLRAEIEILNLKIVEIDRLKKFEDLVHSQRWGELGQLAESMKSLSRTMANSGSVHASFEDTFKTS